LALAGCGEAPPSEETANGHPPSSTDSGSLASPTRDATDGASMLPGPSEEDSQHPAEPVDETTTEAGAGHHPATGGRAPIVPHCDSPLTFADPGVEHAVRSAIQKPNGPLSAADVAQLSNLNLDSTFPNPASVPVSIGGVECLSHLTGFNVEHNL